MNFITSPVVSYFSAVNKFIASLGLNFVSAIKIVFRGLFPSNLYLENFYENLRKVTWSCLPIATLTVSASAVIYAIHIAPEFSTRGLDIYLGGLIALALTREGVPVMASLAIITQYCTGMTAQVGSMKVTEQIDAMKTSRVDPVAYLLVPMLLAGLIGFPIMVITCIFVGLLVNFFFTNFLISISLHLYLNSILSALQANDIFLALVKASVFGLIVTLVSFTCGMLTVGGSKAVGNSTRLSVVISFAVVVILDYIITVLWI